MGLFSKRFREGKVYNTSDALKILKQKGFEIYTTKEVSGGYMIVNEAEERAKESQKVSQKERQQEFNNRINGNGAYKEIKYVPCDYEKAKNRTNRWKAKDFTRG